jgi:hypothetical protein
MIIILQFFDMQKRISFLFSAIKAMIHVSIFALILLLSVAQMCLRTTAIRGPGNNCITTSSKHPSYPFILLYRGAELRKMQDGLILKNFNMFTFTSSLFFSCLYHSFFRRVNIMQTCGQFLFKLPNLLPDKTDVPIGEIEKRIGRPCLPQISEYNVHDECSTKM